MMAQNKGASAKPTEPGSAKAPEPHPGLRPSGAVSSAVAKLRENAEALDAWSKSFDEHVKQASDPLFGRGYGIEERVMDLFRVTARLSASIYGGLLEAASAIEAATAGETVKLGSTEGESAVGATSAETPPLSSPRRG